MLTSAITTRNPRVLFFALAALVVLAYLPGLGGGFIFDDRPNITANIALQVTAWDWDAWRAAILSSPASNFPRPLAMFSFAVNHFMTGLDPVPMKWTNIFIHLVNTWLVFRLAGVLIRLGRPTKPNELAWFALFVAAIWALNPINLMSVLYVVQRMESLSHLFVFAGLLLYLNGRERLLAGAAGGWSRILVGMLGGATLGLMAKESALLLPLYAFLVELCLLRFNAPPVERRRLKALFVLCLLLPALFAVAWLLPPVLGPNPFPWRNYDLAERLLTEARVVASYFSWTVYPNLQAMGIYQDDFIVSRSLLSPPSTLFAIAFLATMGITGLWFAAKRKWPLLALGLLWFLSAHLLTATIIPLELVFEHRNYFASLGICLVIAEGLMAWLPTASGRYAKALGALMVLCFFLATATRAWEWRDPLAFAISEAAKRPNSPRAVYALGVELSNLGGLTPESPLAIAAFNKFDQARALPGSDTLPDQAALMLAARLGLPDQDEWWAHMQNSLRTRYPGPQDMAALRGLVECEVNRVCNFAPGRMMETFKAAMSKGPNPEVQNLLGSYALNKLQQPDFALYLWHSASTQNPTEPQYLISMAKLLIALGRFDEASEMIKKLRAMGRLGKNTAVANQLQARLDGARPRTVAPGSSNE